MIKIPNFENSRWRTAAILKIVLSLYLNRFQRNLVRRCRLCFQGRLLNKIPKFCKFKMVDGRHVKNVFFSRYISAEINPITTEFGVQMQILVPIRATSQNIKILQIQYGGRPPYWKIISTTYCPINAKLGTKKQDHVRHRSRDQNAKFRKFKMTDGRHFENGLIAISADNHPFSMKFGMQTQILVLRMVTWQNIKILLFKMADGRHFENRFWLYLKDLLSDWCKIWYKEVE